MANTTYAVKLSLDGNHTVSVTSDDEAAAETAVSWANSVFARMAKDARRKRGAAKATADEPPGEAPLCAVHQVPMAWMRTARGSFWSCHQRDANGSFCSYRPKPQANGQ